jgi:hypothetical protein
MIFSTAKETIYLGGSILIAKVDIVWDSVGPKRRAPGPATFANVVGAGHVGLAVV